MSNVVHLPSAVNPDPLSASFTLLQGHVQQARADAVSESFAFAEVEDQIEQAIAQVKLAALAAVMEATRPSSSLIEVDGERYRRMDRTSTGTYLTRAGAVQIERALFRQAGVHNGPTVDPIAVRCGLVESRLTPGAAAAFAHLAQAMPSREAKELCGSLGVMPYSRSALHRNGLVVGRAWDRFGPEVQQELMDATEIPEEAAVVSVAIDRVSLPMAEDRPQTDRDVERGVERPISVEMRMAYCAVWTLHNAAGEPLHSVRYAHVPEWGPT